MSQIKKKFIQNNAIDGSKIRLLNNQTLRAVDTSGVDRDLFYFSNNNEWYFSIAPKLSADPQSANELVRKSYVDTQFNTEQSARIAADLVEQSARIAADDALDARLDVLEGADNVEGSVAKAEKDAKDYTDQKISDLINGAPGVLDTLKELSDALGGDENFAATLSTQLAGIQTDISNLQSASSGDLAAEESARIAADNALDSRLDVLEGADNVEGSVAKAEKDAKDYADSIVDAEESARIAADLTEQTARQNAVLAEQSARIAADDALDGRLDVLEGADSVEGSVAKAEKDAKDYADSIVDAEESARIAADLAEQTARVTADTTLQSNINAEITARQSAVAAEESARVAADDALDARLDTLEGDDTTEGSVAKAEKDAKDYADSQDLILQGQIDQLDGYTLDLRNDLDTETSSRISGDLTEQSARISADTTLQSNINAEITARQNADSAIQSELDATQTGAGLGSNGGYTASASSNYMKSTDFSGASLSANLFNATVLLDTALKAEESARTSADLVEKTARMAADTNLQGQIDTEKGRIDAILLASDADKDSFAEIVSLINSVDTTNDNAFAAYVLSNDAALEQEVSDREAGDLTEQSARIAADDVLQGNIDAEQTARENAVLDLQNKIDSTNSGAGLDASGNYQVNNSSNYLTSSDFNSNGIGASVAGATRLLDIKLYQSVSSINSDIDAEESARIAADTTLQNNINAEITARSAAVTAEASARQAADDALDGRLDVLEGADNVEGSVAKAEKDAKDYADSIVNAEITARSAAVTAEASLRQAADSTLQSNLNSEITARQNAVAAEETARIAADGVLQGNIDAEESARENADLVEQSARIAADTTLQNNINAEQTARIAADNALDGRLDVLEGADNVEGSVAKAEKDAKDYTDAEVSNEASLRSTADEALQDQIDTLNAVVHEKQKFVLSGTDISNGYINLSHAAFEKSILVTVDRLVVHAGDDYTVSVVGGVTRLTFTGPLVNPGDEELVSGDVVRVMYRYQG